MNDLKSNFLGVYSILKSELLQDPSFEYTDYSRQWIDRILDQNVPRGMIDRGLSVVYCYKSLKEGKEVSDEEIFLASVLGWCLQWLQAFDLIVDDIIHNSHTTLKKPTSDLTIGKVWCSHESERATFSLIGLIIRHHINRMLKNHFRDKPYYVDLVDLFNQADYQSCNGEMLYFLCTNEGEKDLSKYSIPLYFRISEYKGTYNSIYLPVACALLMAGENLDGHLETRTILIEMEAYFQVQDDYLNCFGDTQVTGKVATDIEDGKCSWLMVKAVELANEEQKKLLIENYGKADPACVAKVKELYQALDLQRVYKDYQRKSYEKLTSSITTHPSKAANVMGGKYIASRARFLKS